MGTSIQNFSIEDRNVELYLFRRDATPSSYVAAVRDAAIAVITVFVAVAASALGKIACKFNFLLVVFLLSSTFHRVGCGAHNIYKQPSTTLEYSDLPESNLVKLITELAESKPLSLQLLYDGDNEEKAYRLSRLLSLGMFGVSTFYFDNQTKAHLDVIIKSASQGTSLVTLCSFVKVLETFAMISAKRIQSHFVNWILVFKNEEAKKESMDALQSLIFEGTHVTLVNQETSGAFLVHSANVKEDGIMRFYYKGRWRSNYEGKRPQLMPLYDPNQYLNMNGRLLRVAANHDPPSVQLGDQNADGSFPMLGGIDYNILESLRRSLNFTYKVFSPADGGWGYPQPDGTITGMIGMVARREVHLAVTGIAVNVARKGVIDYTRPYFLGYMCIYSKALSEKSREFAILAPFSLKVWICIVVSTLAIGPVLKIQSKLSETFGAHDASRDLQNFSFNMFRNLVSQGNLLESGIWSQRLIFFFWYFFCLIISVLYSSTLTAVFAVPAYEKPIDSLEDLPRAVQNGLTLTVVGDSTNEYMFKDATGGIYKQTWELFNHKDRSKSFVETSDIGMKLVLEGKAVHIVPRLNGRIISVQMGKENFYSGRESFYPQSDAFVLPQGSPYRGVFDNIIEKIVGAGLVAKWEEDEIKKMAKKSAVENKTSKTLVISLVHLQAAFFLLLLGYSIALSVLMSEVFVWTLFLKEKA